MAGLSSTLISAAPAFGSGALLGMDHPSPGPPVTTGRSARFHRGAPGLRRAVAPPTANAVAAITPARLAQ